MNKEQIINLYNSGKTYVNIAEVFSVSRQRIHQIVKGYHKLRDKKLRQEVFERDNYV